MTKRLHRIVRIRDLSEWTGVGALEIKKQLRIANCRGFFRWPLTGGQRASSKTIGPSGNSGGVLVVQLFRRSTR